MAQVCDVYPSEILPRVVYKKRLDVDRLLGKYPRLLVVRMVDGRIDDYLLDSESGDMILSEKVFKNNMADLSMNLAGALFDTRSQGHLGYLPTKKEAIESWKGSRTPQRLYATSDCFDKYEPCFGLCFFVAEIHERTFPFHKHFESVAERDAYAEQASRILSVKEKAYQADFVGAFESKKKNVKVCPRIKVHHLPTRVNYWHMAFESKKKNVKVCPRIKVHHLPTRVNYWHMTLDTYRPIDMDYVRPEERLDSSDIKMFKALKQDLVLCCKVNEVPTYRIEERDYYKSVCYYLWILPRKIACAKKTEG